MTKVDTPTKISLKEKLGLELLDCPCCGHTIDDFSVAKFSEDVLNVECPDCGLVLLGADYLTPEELATAWNTRSYDARLLHKEGLEYLNNFKSLLNRCPNCTKKSSSNYGEYTLFRKVLTEIFLFDESDLDTLEKKICGVG